MHYLNCDFKYVLQETADYLGRHPSEFVIMNVQEEYETGKRGTGTKTFDEKVTECLENMSGYIYKGGRNNPTVAEMRGKIVILTRSRPVDYCLRWSDFIVENTWDSTKDEKINAVKNSLDEARIGNQEEKFLTFTNYTHGWATVNSTTEGINPSLHHYVRENFGRLGITVMNYPGPNLIRDIINHNF